MVRELGDIIGTIEAAPSLAELQDILQKVVESCGFAAFSFVDQLHAGVSDPIVINSIRPAFDCDYRTEKLLAVDPILPVIRRSNTPFTWGSVPLPPRLGRRVPGALKTLHLAHDHGYREGLVVPFHYVDSIGRPRSTVCTFFWSETEAEFSRSVEEHRTYLHMVLLYWAQRVVELNEGATQRSVRLNDNAQSDVPLLTDREREVLAWAARGKTVQDTADILCISTDTVETHIRACIRKLEATNKTHAVARAIFLRLIEY